MKTYAEKKLEEIESREIAKAQSEEIISKIKRELGKAEKIDAVVLFGSFARGDYSERHSDLDVMVFLDKEEKDAKLEEEILKKVIRLNLGKIVSVHTVFQYRKVEDEDNGLLLTISDEGKVLFSKKSIVISSNILGLKKHILVKFDSAGISQVKKNKLQRFLYGYSAKGRKYKGIVDNEKVANAGKGAVIARKETADKILLFANSIGIKAKITGEYYR